MNQFFFSKIRKFSSDFLLLFTYVVEQCKLFPRPARGMSYGILWSIRCGTVQTVPPPRQGHELQHALECTLQNNASFVLFPVSGIDCSVLWSVDFIRMNTKVSRREKDGIVDV